MAAAKIQTVKGERVEIFSRSLRKNTTRPLTVWIGGTDIERGLLSMRRCAILVADKFLDDTSCGVQFCLGLFFLLGQSCRKRSKL